MYNDSRRSVQISSEDACANNPDHSL